MTIFNGFFSRLLGYDASAAVVVDFSAGSYIGMRMQNQDNLRAGARVPYIGSQKQFSRQGTLQLRGMDIFCVCDGIGGGYRGDLAAKYALKAIRRYLKSELPRNAPLRELLLDAAEHAHQEVCGFYQAVRAQGGCTLVMMAIRGDEYAFLNIGDSPGFLIPVRGQIRELSCRHNLAWERLRMDLPAERSDSNQLLRYLGMENHTVTEIASVTEGYLKEGDRVLLCTDGVTNTFSLPSLERAVRTGRTAGDITAASAQTMGSDNCTAVCLTIREILAGPYPVSTQDTDSAEPELAPETESIGGDEHDTGTDGATGAGDHPM